MMFQEFLETIATWLNSTSQTVGILLSLIISIALVLIIAIATKGKKFELVGMIMFIASTVLFTAIGWHPLYTGTILALIVALAGGYYFSKMGGGGD